jgi:hypothetical protein
MNCLSDRRLIVLTFLLVAPLPSRAQDPLGVEVLESSHRNWDAITVRVKNVTNQVITLAVPFNIARDGSSTVLPLPIDVERREGAEWKLCLPTVHRLPSQTMTLNLHGKQTRTFLFGVSGPGQYRVRVWYIADPGDLGPPKRLPDFESVVSQPFEVIPHESIPTDALPALAALCLRPLRLCGTIKPSR